MKRKIFVLFFAFATFAAVNASRLSRSQRSAGTCGIPQRKSGLVVRGQSFSRGDYPWIVALMYTGTKPPSFFCGGTIISSTFVLSAAHCINPNESHDSLNPRDVLAYFGAHDLNNYLETGRFPLSPVNIILHDDWNPSTIQFDADLSLLEFEEGSIHFNTYVQPICLWSSTVEPISTEGIAVGWGKSEDPTKKHENMPKLVTALIQSNEQCFLDESALLELSSERTFCAGLRNGSGVCAGDSGGGLFISVDDVLYLKGVVSSSLFKNGVCDVSRNAVYTNVLKFRDWISKMTGAMKQVFCNFKMKKSNYLIYPLNTCLLNETVDIEVYELASELDATVTGFIITKNKEMKFLPKRIGENFPNLIEFRTDNCGLTVARNYFFENMQNLEFLNLNSNKIATVESDAFKDLIKVQYLNLNDNMIETLSEKVFKTNVDLLIVYLINNKIKVLNPNTFKIPGGKLRDVHLKGNVCIDKNLNAKYAYNDLVAECTR